MLSDVIKKYGGEKMDPLDVYSGVQKYGLKVYKSTVKKHIKRVQFLRLNLFYYIYICLIYV